jgi:hypothetical protein
MVSAFVTALLYKIGSFILEVMLINGQAGEVLGLLLPLY